MCTKSNYQSHGINIPTVWQVTAPSFQPPAAAWDRVGRQHLHNTGRELPSKYWDIYRGKKKGGVCLCVWWWWWGVHRRAFSSGGQGKSPRRPYQSMVHSSPFCLPVGNTLIADNATLILITEKPFLFCYESVNSARFVSWSMLAARETLELDKLAHIWRTYRMQSFFSNVLHKRLWLIKLTNVQNVLEHTLEMGDRTSQKFDEYRN